MKLFFICNTRLFGHLKTAFEKKGVKVQYGHHADDLDFVQTYLPLANAESDGSVQLIIGERGLVKGKIERYLAQNFSHVPVLLYMFDRDAIERTGWDWYADETLRQIKKGIWWPLAA